MTKEETMSFASENINRMTLSYIAERTGWSVSTLNRWGIHTSTRTLILEEPEYEHTTVNIPEWKAKVKLRKGVTIEQYMKKVEEFRTKDKERHMQRGDIGIY